MFVNLQGIKNWFDDYADSFDLSVDMIRMKYEHSWDVMRTGEMLTDRLGWDDRDKEVGIAACLLHDTGRFTQYRDFGTYYDGSSVDHGERGYDVLRTELPDKLTDSEGREALLQSVRWHNKKHLPENLPLEVAPFCQLARDSDKLDVFSLVRRRMDEGTVGELLPRHKVDAPLSESLLEEIENNWSGSYRNASSLADFLLIQLTWALDMNFNPSLQMLEESKVLAGIRDIFPKDDCRVQGLLEKLFLKIEQHKESMTQ